MKYSYILILRVQKGKKKKDAQDKFIQQTDRITKMVLLGILVGGTLAIYGLVTLIGKFL